MKSVGDPKKKEEQKRSEILGVNGKYTVYELDLAKRRRRENGRGPLWSRRGGEHIGKAPHRSGRCFIVR